MINCEILKFGVKNFCNHTDEIEIDLENKAGTMTIITGKNGMGKTALFQSIPFTLYGHCEKGRPDDVVNNRTKKDCHTWAEFRRDDKKYRVDRYVADTKNRDNVFMYEILGDGTLNIIAKGQKEVLPLVEKILVSAQLFSNTILFSQKVKSFFTDLTDAAQKEIFRKILKLDEFVDYQEFAKKKYDSTEAELNEAKNNIEIYSSNLELNKEYVNKLVEDRKRFIAEQISKISEIENEIAILTAEKDKFESEHDLSSYEQVNKDIELAESNLSKLTLEKNNLINEKESIITKSDSDLTKASLELKNNLFLDKKTASTKFDALKMQIRTDFNTQNESLINQKSELTGQIATLKNEYDNEINSIRSEKMKNEMEISQNLQSLKAEVQAEITDSNQSILDEFTAIDKKITTQINFCENKKTELKSKISFLESDVMKFRTEIARYQVMIESGIGECPTCLQSLLDMSHLETHILKLKGDIEKISIERNVTDQERDAESVKIFEFQEKIKQAEETKRVALESLKSFIEVKKKELIDQNQKLTDALNEKYNSLIDIVNQKYDELSNVKNNDLTRIQNEIDVLVKHHDESIKGVDSDLVIFENKLDLKYEADLLRFTDDLKIILHTDLRLCENRLDVINKDIEVAENVLTFIKQKKSGLDNIIIELQKIIEQIKSKNHLMEVEKGRKYDDTTLKLQVEKQKEIKHSIKIYLEQESRLTSLLEIIRFWWKKAFSSGGIQSMLIDEAIPFMNKRVNEYLDLLSNGRYRVSFDTMKQTKSGEFRDKISVNVFDNVTLSDSRTKFSGGQERIVDIATILTLNDLQAFMQNLNVNIILFDEIFDALDEENVENVISMLKKVIGEKVCFLISHLRIDHIDFDERLSMG